MFRPLFLGRSANVTDFEVDDEVEDLGLEGDDVPVVCDLFIFFAGGGLFSVDGEDLETAGR